MLRVYSKWRGAKYRDDKARQDIVSMARGEYFYAIKIFKEC